MPTMRFLYSLGIVALFCCTACDRNTTPTPHQFKIPIGFPPLLQPADNIATEEGISLGKKLFFDKKLSKNGQISCASCHNPALYFTDANRFSQGVLGQTTRHSMPLFNVGYTPDLFWDGHRNSLETQALLPIEGHNEFAETWDNVVQKLKADAAYPSLFLKAFQVKTFDKSHVTKALAQYQRTLFSGNAKYDSVQAKLAQLSPKELGGYNIFNTERGDCFHCHGTVLFTDLRFRNNGLNAVPSDSGYYYVSKNPADIGKFRSPSLRNVALTAPYMHDGRFSTLEQVLDHYSEGVERSRTLDPIILKRINKQFTEAEKDSLIAFLKTLTDYRFTQTHR
jgi:cytochrome c peroxidase